MMSPHSSDYQWFITIIKDNFTSCKDRVGCQKKASVKYVTSKMTQSVNFNFLSQSISPSQIFYILVLACQISTAYFLVQDSLVL